MPVAATFAFRGEHGFSLGDGARLDSMVTVVDAASLARQLEACLLTGADIAAGAGAWRRRPDPLLRWRERAG